jgi:hypothetical protein
MKTALTLRPWTRLCWLLFVYPLAGHTEPAAVIEGLQAPAWIQRGNSVQALHVDTQLSGRDRIMTGTNGKVLIRLAEGSHVKIGSDANVAFIKLRTEKRFKGFLKIARGAFRFTTTALGVDKRRDMRIQVGVAVAGIRGTDIWGKPEDSRDLICLIEGNINITRGNDAPVTLSEPLDVYTATRNKAADPLWKVNIAQLQTWAGETELDSGAGIIIPGGTYIAYLAEFAKQSDVDTLAAQLRRAGYAAETFMDRETKPVRYRIAIRGFASKGDAEHFGKSLRGRYGITHVKTATQTIQEF